jgi:hypothetical protein
MMALAPRAIDLGSLGFMKAICILMYDGPMNCTVRGRLLGEAIPRLSNDSEG